MSKEIVYHDRLPATTAEGEPVEYRPDPGEPQGHVAGTDGSVWSRLVKGSKIRTLHDKWRRLKCSAAKNGYPSVSYTRHGRDLPHTVHTIILEAFVGPCPPGMECRHKDGNPLNNKLSNLAWGTYEEQAADKARHGTLLRGEACPAAVLNPLKVRAVRALDAAGFTQGEIGLCLGVGVGAVQGVLAGRSWKHVAADWHAQQQS